MIEKAYAIIRPDGTIQKTHDVRFEASQLEIYTTRDAAEFIRDKAYPSSEVREMLFGIQTMPRCKGCGEQWPCSDCKRTDISGRERAKHHL